MLSQQELQELDFFNHEQNNEGQVISKDLRKIVKDTSLYPYCGIGKIVCRSFNPAKNKYQEQTGTGGIISNNLILTCAHVLLFKERKSIADQIYFTPESNQSAQSRISLKVMKFFSPNQYFNLSVNNKSRSKNDFAILVLQFNEIIRENRFLKLGSSDLQTEVIKNSQLLISGYSGKLQQLKYRQFQEVQNGTLERNGFIYYRHTTEAGNSGGPVLLVRDQGDYELIGIHKGSTPQYNFCLSLKTILSKVKDLKNQQSLSEQVQCYISCYKPKSQPQNLKQNQSLQDINQKYKILQEKQKQINQKVKLLQEKSFQQQQTMQKIKTSLKEKQKVIFIQQSYIEQLHTKIQFFEEENQKLRILIEKIASQSKQNQIKRKPLKQQIYIKKLELQTLQKYLLIQSYPLPQYYLQSIFGKDQKKMSQNYSKISQKYVNQAKVNWNLNLSPNGFMLFHSGIQINMKKFVKHNWSSLEYLTLSGCKVDDDKWRMLVDNAFLFYKLKWVEIHSNNITTIKQGDLEKFVQLERIYFYYKNQDKILSNPLSIKSKQILLKLKQGSSKIKIVFQDQKN